MKAPNRMHKIRNASLRAGDPSDYGRAVTYLCALAQRGMPGCAASIARRYEIRFNPATLRKWRRAGGPLATMAVLLLMDTEETP